MNNVVKERNKKLDIDLWIIGLVSMAVFAIYGSYAKQIVSFCKDSAVSVWARLSLSAVMEYGIAGLGITIVCIFRRESFRNFGLRKENTLKTIFGTIVCFLPYILFVMATGRFEGYAPLSVMVSDDLHRAGIFTTVVGTLIIAVVWGFFEGFNYAVISEIINRRYPVKSRFFNWGGVICGIMCTLFHPFSLDLPGIIEIVTTFVAIYGMLWLYKKNHNAWGCVFAFIFIWNAI